ncbi:MAG: DNA translocase FtsK [Candidatus Omnitrophica bacterium]|nr:DNA translocase FtsK [Candidatus Omnitrophota bacterium]
MPARPRKKRFLSINKELQNDIWGILLFVGSLLLLMSLWSYHPDDLPFFTSEPSREIRNLCGIVGAFVAGVVRSAVGLAGFFLPFLGFSWSVARLSGKPPQRSFVKVGSTILFSVASSGFLAIILDQSRHARVERGGVVGDWVGEQIVQYFGWWGAAIVFATIGLLCFLVVTELLFWPMMVTLGRAASSAWGRMAVGLSDLLGSVRVGDSARRNIVHRSPAEEPIVRSERQKTKLKIKEAPSVKERPMVIKEAEEPALETAVRPAPKPPRLTPLKTAPAEPADAPVKAVAKPAEKKEWGAYRLPSLDLLELPVAPKTGQGKETVEQNARLLENSLREFGIEVKVAEVEIGPVITRYELEPAPGVKVQKITTLSDDLALVLKAPSIRIIAPIPGKARVGIEVPNAASIQVTLRDVLESKEFRESTSKLTLAFGKDTAGHPLVADLGEMPHLLIAGTTGSGKTVCVNALITSLLFNAAPEDVRMIMVDPKMVELSTYNGLPHLIVPVLTDPKKVPVALQWVVEEMENRYQLFAKLGVRNIEAYREKKQAGQLPEEEIPENLPYLVIIIDELADLMITARAEIETTITRLAQLSRAVGIHMVLATQRPSVDVLTGVIKANFPARISFQVASKVDSRTVLDSMGAEKLLGKGDLLFMQPGSSKLTRAQGCLVTDQEIERVVSFIKEQRPPQYENSILEIDSKMRQAQEQMKDSMYDEALRVVVETGQASVSLLQRRMRLGYGRAARILDMMEREGIVGPIRGAKPREVYLKEVPTDESRATEVSNP